MASWRDLEQAAPHIARAGRALLDQARVALLGTLRPDGSPRISPVEPYFADGLTRRLNALGIRPGPDRSTALFQLAAEIPAAILARTLDISTKAAVTWQRHAAGDWITYAADVSRRHGNAGENR